MIKRFLCILLSVILMAGVLPAAMSETELSAADALFGDGNFDPNAPSQPEDSGVTYDGNGDTDIYGNNDTASRSVYPTLRLGDSDSADGVAYIVFLQNRLIELGYLTDAADGHYGSSTETAITNFQRRNNLQSTGIADPETQAKLYSDITTLERPSVEDSLFTSDTMKVQNALVLWGFMFNQVDGVIGDNTKACIKEFKEYMTALDPTFGATPTPAPTATPSVNTDTVFGEMPVAMDTLLDGSSAIGLNADGSIDKSILEYANGEKQFSVFRQVVRNGDMGPEVKRVQKRLKYLKYLYRADGSFGNLTELALKYFQRKNGLPESGVADQQTQVALFSANAQPAEEYVFPYKIIVDISDQRVYVGSWNGTAYHDLVKKMKCSTGKDSTPTPLGTYQCDGKAGDMWYYFKDFNCYAKWATRIVGGILFHSITYNSNKVQTGSVRSLGRKASHGCIRLSVEDAKWIFDNIPAGTTVVIQE